MSSPGHKELPIRMPLHIQLPRVSQDHFSSFPKAELEQTHAGEFGSSLHTALAVGISSAQLEL